MLRIRIILTTISWERIECAKIYQALLNYILRKTIHTLTRKSNKDKKGKEEPECNFLIKFTDNRTTR